ncbi:hypothetical protein SAPIO_CDS4966 [Scedosporium apiospermum]|uniref:Major facilitator superfamily transporter n=1 Tax=Pseudallescheria apiosperma TaxID=563466 RepID=A0A084G6Y1_PSEDA|nr:uncharacterized protein SAPIO_CDS4966 [Scedosporium apiospermum]KEZ43093.1 hypothetical protein SAPIO_CDS4966 [Scedosporium apiospermum]
MSTPFRLVRSSPYFVPKSYRYYLAGLTSAALFLATFLNVGPSVTLVEMAIDLFGVMPPNPEDPASLAPTEIAVFQHAITKTSYLFSGAALMQGVSNLVWMPLAVKYGRRPVYTSSFALYLATTIWAGRATSFPSELAARLLMGWVSPGRPSAWLRLPRSSRLRGCRTHFGLISIREDWRVIYYVGTGILGLLVLLIALSMPETAYRRESQSNPDPADEIGDISKTGGLVAHVEGSQQREETASKAPWRQSLNMFTGRKTEESLWLIFIRPVVMLVIPPVLWAILVLGVNVGFTVAISTSVASSFTVVYGFTTWHIGLVWLSNLIGCVLGMPFAGKLSDRVADMFTRRNGGIREGEMRLPTMVIGMVLMPVSIILYGLGLNYQLHWIVPTIALGIFGFCLVIVGNVSLAYTVDAFRPIAGEVVVTQMGFKRNPYAYSTSTT